MNHFAAFYSDPHIGHKNIIEYSARPFSSVEEMNEALINNYNERIKTIDTVLWLGDCFFTKPDIATTLLSRMNGSKVLLFGNHDRSSAAMARIGFMGAAERLTMCINGSIVRAAHHPEKVGTGEICMHGHTHSNKRRQDNRIHVGVDAWDYRPAMYEEVEALVGEIVHV